MAKSCVPFALLAVVVLSFGRPMSSSDHAGSARDKLVGAWRLVSEEDQEPDGKIVKVDHSGVLIYTRDGHVAVEVMAPPGSAAETNGGFIAYFGDYKVDETARTITFHVEGALLRSQIGKDLIRKYHFSGRQLILTFSKPGGHHGTTIWEHY